MDGNIIFVGTYSLPENRFDEWDAAIRDMVDFVKANVPRLISFDVFISADMSEATSIYVHPDADSFAEHMKAAATRVNAGAQMVSVVRIDVYGDPGEQVIARLQQVSEASNHFPVSVKSHYYS